MTRPLETVCLDGQNSIEFLQAAFDSFSSGQLFSVVRPGTDISDYPGLISVANKELNGATGWGELDFVLRDSDDPAQVLFSSGTEGKPKPIVLSARNISDVIRRLNAAMDLTEEVREYIGVPVTYSFGLARARAVSAAGGRFYLPQRFDPAEIRRMLDAGDINAVSAVPTLWRLVLQNPSVLGAAAQKVRWIEIGSQYMSQAEKLAMRELFPNARIIQHYGLTEASRTTFLDVGRCAAEILESVGAPSPPSQVKIGAQGEICIRGDHVALGIVTQDGAITPLIAEDGWFHTKDSGEIRDGVLYYRGRIDDLINIGGIKLSAESFEREVAEICGGEGEFAVSRLPDPLRGEKALLAIRENVGDMRPLIETAASIALRRKGIEPQGSIETFTLKDLPVTGTGKVQRAKLPDAYLAERSGADVPETGSNALDDAAALTELERRIVATWQSVIGAVKIGPDDTLFDIGGDSLSAMQIGLAMEGIYSRAAINATFQGQSVRRVARLDERAGGEIAAEETDALPQKTVENWSINLTRGVMVLCVILSHWSPGVFMRLGVNQQSDLFFGWFYAMGTEGFATVFGFGMGYYFLKDYPGNADVFGKRRWLSLCLVLAGLCLLAITELALGALEGQPIDGRAIAVSFYNILAFYVLALLTIGLWFKLIASAEDRFWCALSLAALSILIYWLCQWLFPQQIDGLGEWPRLMVVAGYSYFRVGAVVFLGIAAGYWFASQSDRAPAIRTLRNVSLAVVITGLVIGMDFYGPEAFAGRRGAFYNGAAGWLFYAGLVLLLFALVVPLVQRWSGLARAPKLVAKCFISIGCLALPIYAFHGLVIPVKDIFVVLGAPGVVALAFPMGLFLLVIGFFFTKLWRLHFG